MSNSPDQQGSSKGKPKRRKSKSSPRGQTPLGKQASTDAGRRAAAILEVLGGLRTPAEAAAALNVSVTHYYLLERKALAGLLAACEAQPKGHRGGGLERQVASLQRQLEQCQRECMRQAALVRATQRAVGLPATAVAKRTRRGNKSGGQRRRRRPTVRALRMAERVRKNSSGEHSTAELEQASTEGVMDHQTGTLDKETRDGTQG